MRRFVTLSLLACFGFVAPLTAAASTPTAHPFDDIYADSPYFDAATYLKTNGLIEGYANGKFMPDASVNRAEFLKMISGPNIISQKERDTCMANLPAGSTVVFFPDVPRSAWYAPNVCIAHSKGFVQGYPDGLLHPERTITFAEEAKIFAALFVGDLPADSVWYRPSVTKLEEFRMIPTSIFTLDQQMSRGDTAEILYRLKADVHAKDSVTLEALQKATDLHTVIDLNTLKIGDKVGGMTLKSGTWQAYDAGDAVITFEGPVTITAHFVGLSSSNSEGEMGPSDTVCFSFAANQRLSQALIPMMPGRPSSFCLSYKDPFIATFGLPSAGTATITLKTMTINYFGAEVWDAAELSKVSSVQKD